MECLTRKNQRKRKKKQKTKNKNKQTKRSDKLTENWYRINTYSGARNPSGNEQKMIT